MHSELVDRLPERGQIVTHERPARAEAGQHFENPWAYEALPDADAVRDGAPVRLPRPRVHLAGAQAAAGARRYACSSTHTHTLPRTIRRSDAGEHIVRRSVL